MWSRWDSNPPPIRCQRIALPNELLPHTCTYVCVCTRLENYQQKSMVDIYTLDTCHPLFIITFRCGKIINIITRLD